MYFGRDIETIQKIYQRHRNDPPVAWDLPPIAGKIAWARQMYRRIQEPMEMFQKYPTILQTPEAKKIIKNYNKLAKVLLEFEVLYHQAWMQQVNKNFIIWCFFPSFSFADSPPRDLQTTAYRQFCSCAQQCKVVLLRIILLLLSSTMASRFTESSESDLSCLIKQKTAITPREQLALKRWNLFCK